MTMQRFGYLFLISLVAPGADLSKLPAPASRTVDFARDIQPLLKARCQGCHGAAMQSSGLRLDNGADALRGGYSGAVIQPGKSAESRLIHLVAGAEDKIVMPPVGPRLTAEEVGILRAWIDQGAKWPGAAPAAIGTHAKGPEHWSFQPLRRPALPETRNRSWARNPIDSFVMARLEQQGIDPSPEAPKTTLIRRVYLDLIGLPPEPEEVKAFLEDNRPDAYERVVDHLLDSPHYGEKWARFWLDQARYADSDGYEKDLDRPYAWRYRQWVIDALNRDEPFDQFTIEQIAGDLLPDATIDQKVATGFHRNTLTNREGGVKIEQFRDEQVMDRAATVGTVWLGLTVGCAECHDHKYDPITQKDFYRLYAYFNNADEVNIEAPMPGEMGPYLRALPDYRRRRDDLLKQYHVFELQPAWEAQMKEARANPGKWTDWDHAYDAFQKYLDNADRILDTPPAQRNEYERDALADHFIINYHRVISKERWKELNYTELRKRLDELRDAFPAISRAPVLAELPGVHRKSFIHIRGDYRKQGAEVEAGVPAFLPPLPPGSPPNRLGLARWLVSPENPLTARVAVNRMWQEFFGRGLVDTPEDFGRQGGKPSHPELLDWLAVQFRESGWRVKPMHRLIVTSAAYRQASAARPDMDERDPNNELLARQKRMRLPAELIRDASLTVSGLLYPAIGGKSVRPPQPQGVAELAYANSVKWRESEGRDRYRRGMYILYQRTVPYPLLANFDAPDSEHAACRRERSNTPLQALNLLNDPVFVEAAQALAARILRDRPSAGVGERIDYAFLLCFSRRPTTRERNWMTEYYNRQNAIFEKDPKSSQAFAAENGAWTGVASVLLNLDEFITRE